MKLRTLVIVGLALMVPAALGSGCDSDAEVSSSNSGGSGASSGGGSANGGGSAAGGNGSGGNTSSGGNGAGTGAGVPTEIATCQGHIYECGDLLDNDMDGLIDSQDPDCLGPCDNTEDSYYGGIPGQNAAPCKQDCYWDQDTGSGNDDCYWSHKCDPNSVPPNYYPEPSEGDKCEYDPQASIAGTQLSCAELDQTQSTICQDYCGPLTPNGCDCFGCCEFPVDSGSYIWLGSQGLAGDTLCTGDKLTDPSVCHPCQPVDACLNDCDVCEVCFGKPILPPECFPGEGGGGGMFNPSGSGGGSNTQCPPELQPCGQAGQDPCPSGKYCITGCCVDVPN